MKKNISLSILKLEGKEIPEFLRKYKEDIEKIEKLKIDVNKFSYLVHFDVMDNKFVQNNGVDLKYIKTAKNLGLYVDTHLMVENPIGDKYIEQAIEFGTDDITIHYEINNFEGILNYLNEKKEYLKRKFNRNLNIGVSIKPKTEVKVLEKFKDRFSKILIMSVEPGFGGQEYLEKTNEKIKEAVRLFPKHTIQVDGGINFNTLENVLSEKVESIVMGSYLTNNYNSTLLCKMQMLEMLKSIEELPKDRNIEFDKKILQIVKGGYGENDILKGISVPNIRKIANKWYKVITKESLVPFISSKYHEYRQFACIILSNLVKKELKLKDEEKRKHQVINIISFFEDNLKYINNWDLTDEVATNILGSYLILLKDKDTKKELDKYLKNDIMWVRRIGILSTLTYVKKGYKELPFYACKKELYSKEPLINKAVGWVLREIYKKHPLELKEFLKENNDKKTLPKFVMSYATEKMTKEEKEYVKNIKE